MASFHLHPTLATGAILQNNADAVRLFMHTIPKVGVRLSYHKLGTFKLKNDPKLGVGVTFGCAMMGPEYNFPLPESAVKCEAWSVVAETRTQRTAAFAVLRWSDASQVLFGEAEIAGPFDRVRVDGRQLVMVDRSLPSLYDDITSEEDSRLAANATRTDACAGILATFRRQPSVIWRSGMAGGEFCTYYGLDAKNNPVCVVVDFNMLQGGLLGPHIPMPEVGANLEPIPTTPAKAQISKKKKSAKPDRKAAKTSAPKKKSSSKQAVAKKLAAKTPAAKKSKKRVK